MPNAIREMEARRRKGLPESIVREPVAGSEGELARDRFGNFRRLVKRGVRDFLSPENSAEILRERLAYHAPQEIPRSLLAIRAWSAGRNIAIMRRMLAELEHPENKRMLMEGINPYYPGARQVQRMPAFVGRMFGRAAPLPEVLRSALARKAEEGVRGAMKKNWRLLEIVKNNLNTYPGMMMALGGMGYMFARGSNTDPLAVGMSVAAAAGGGRLLIRGEDELGHRLRTVRPSRFYIREQVGRIADYVNLNEEDGRRLVGEIPGILRESIAQHEQRRSALIGAMQQNRFGRFQLGAAERMREAALAGRERFSTATKYMLIKFFKSRRK